MPFAAVTVDWDDYTQMVQTALQPLGLSQVMTPLTVLTNEVFAFIPRLIGAGLIFFAGLILGRIVGHVIEAALGAREAGDHAGGVTSGRKHEPRRLRQPLDQGCCGIGQRQHVFPTVLGELRRNSPNASGEIELIPLHLRNLAATLGGQDQQFGHGAERVSFGIGRMPDGGQFVVGQNPGARAMLGWLLDLVAGIDREHVAIAAPAEESLDDAECVISLARFAGGDQPIQNAVDLRLLDVPDIALAPGLDEVLAEQPLGLLRGARLVVDGAVPLDVAPDRGFDLIGGIIRRLLDEGGIDAALQMAQGRLGFVARVRQREERIAPEREPSRPTAMAVDQDECLGAGAGDTHAEPGDALIPDF